MQVGSSTAASLSTAASQVRLAAHIANTTSFAVSEFESSDQDSTDHEFISQQESIARNELPRGMPDVVIECNPANSEGMLMFYLLQIFRR